MVSRKWVFIILFVVVASGLFLLGSNITQILNPISPIQIAGLNISCPNCGTANNNGYTNNQLLAGCGVEYTSGLSVTVGACTFVIAGVTYTSVATMLTDSTADPSNPRIDLIVVSGCTSTPGCTVGSVAFLDGTPAASPVAPTIDPSTQLTLTFWQVNAGATTPVNVAQTLLYDEDTGGPGEWTATCSTNLNCSSTNNPYHGTKDIEATSAVLNNNFTLVKPAAGTVNLSTLNTVTFYIRSKAQWPTGNAGGNAARYISLYWLNGSTQVGTQVVLRDSTFGFSSAVTGNYQQVSIPLGLFGTGSNLVTTLKAVISGPSGSSSIGWYIDEVTLQSGQSPVAATSTLMNFRGAYSTTTAYNANDLVTSGGIGYVAIVPNVGQSLSTSTLWSPLGGGPSTNSGIRTASVTFDGGGSALSGTTTRCANEYYSGTIQQAVLIADQSGGATVDVRTVAYASYTGPSSASTITASDTPALSSTVKYSDTSLTGWTTSLSQNTIVCFVLSSPSTVTWVQATLKIAAN